VFVDSERETWNMDPELLEVAIKGCIPNLSNYFIVHFDSTQRSCFEKGQK